MTLRLDIELGASLLLDFTYKRGEEVRVAKNVHAAFVGVEHGEYLAVRLTVDPIEKYHYFFSNLANVVVKYILKGTAYAFSCKLLSKTDKPVPLLFLSYPESVETKSLRKDHRARCHPLAMVESKGMEYKAQLYDINLVGCRVDLIDSYSEHTHHLAKEERVAFSFYLPGIAELSKAEAVIKWSRPMGDCWCLGLGHGAGGRGAGEDRGVPEVGQAKLKVSTSPFGLRLFYARFVGSAHRTLPKRLTGIARPTLLNSMVRHNEPWRCAC